MSDITESLEVAANEIAQAGHAGWGNVCLDAKSEIERLRARLAEQVQVTARIAPERACEEVTNHGLRARLEEAEKDATRYRWLRDGGNFRSPLRVMLTDSYVGDAVMTDVQLDELVDAFLAAQEQQ